MTSKRAFGLGPLETIVNIGWGSGEKIAVVEFTYQCQWHLPHFVMSGFAFTNEEPETTADPIEYVVQGTTPLPELVNPISDVMMKKVYWWNRHTQNTFDSDQVYFNRALWFFNLKRIKTKIPIGKTAQTFTDFTFKIRVPAGININQTGTVYWIWNNTFFPTFEENRDNPFTEGSPFHCPGLYCEPSGIIVFPKAFASEAEALAWKDGFAGTDSEPHLFLFAEVTAEPLQDLLSWSTRISTYPKPPDKKRRNFPSDPPDTVNLDWNPNTESKFHAQDSGNWPDFSTPSAARDINYKVNFKTLAVTITA